MEFPYMLKKFTPAFILTGSVMVGALVVLTVIGLAYFQPWLGVTFGVDDEGGVKIVAVDPSGPGAALPVGAVISTIQNDPRGPVLALKATDLVEEPDTLEGYKALKDFFRRQRWIFSLLVAETVELSTKEGVRHEITPAWPRPITSLPAVFWVQLIVGGGSFLIGSWVWSLKRQDLPARILAFVGLSTMTFATAAAIYSTRELALPGGLFRALSAINHLGALSFGAGMIALFLVYPRRLVPTKALPVLPVVFGTWWLCDTLRVVFTGPAEGSHLPTMIEMLGILAAAGVQFWKTKGDAKARATLRWFGLTVALGAGLFVMLVIAPNIVGLPPLVSQGYAFLFFLLVFAGVAVGVARYRLFELEGWAFRILFYLGGVLLLVAVDAFLIFALAMDRTPALSLSLLAVVFLYLPLRELLSKRLMSRKGFRESLFRKMLDVALTTPGGDQGARWRGLLQEVFEPLKIEEGAPLASPAIEDDGVALALPAVGALPPLRLSHAYRGRKLFAPRDVALAEELCSMLRHAIESRTAYEKGVAEERLRIARDMHDNIGAQLISALHSPAAERKDTMIRETLSDIRSIINNAAEAGRPLGETLAELRYEASDRLGLAGVALDWRVEEEGAVELPSQTVHALRSIVREAVSNTLKHSGATSVAVLVSQREGRLWFTITDNGRGLPDKLIAGNGLGNIRARVESLKGTVDIANAQPGLRLHIGIPV
ncbi:MAG: ATP-binding protein [Opitutaceae bacterium]|jgi:signal transduction histidine kinase